MPIEGGRNRSCVASARRDRKTCFVRLSQPAVAALEAVVLVTIGLNINHSNKSRADVPELGNSKALKFNPKHLKSLDLSNDP